MAATESRASWHPAFMPNAVSNLDSRNPYPHPYSNFTTNENSIEETEFLGDVPKAMAFGPGDSRQDVTTETRVPGDGGIPIGLDNNGHPELETLRSALMTSFASPGGVGMNEGSVLDSVTGGEYSNPASDDYTSPRKAGFPSERPAREQGHASTASFARTVPRDMDWGEDDEVDPEWNLQRTETDPFNFIGVSDRTNSFPQVPPAHNPASFSFDHILPKSQAGEIISRVEQTQGFFSEEDGTDDFFNNGAKTVRVSNTNVIDATDRGFDGRPGGAEGSTYGLAYGGEAAEEPEAQSRYEEGLPLVEETEPSEGRVTERENLKRDLFTESAAGEEADFFGELAGAGESKAPPALGRKSTMQVMNAFAFESQENLHHEKLDIEETRNPEISLNNTSGGGIVVSRNTILSHVLSEPEIKFPSRDEDDVVLPNEPSAEDVAAKWKAALAGDELLDEDELLDDDAILEKTAVDPAALFGSDDEGFLDDDEETPLGQSDTQKQISLPIPIPNMGNDGRTVGFHSLTDGAVRQSCDISNRYLPANAAQTPVQQSGNPFVPQAPLLTDLSTQHSRNPLPGAGGFGAVVPSTPLPSYGAPLPQRPDATKSQSFADKSKGGYSSPYDLPMEVVKPRKRASIQHMARGYSNVPPPSTIPPPRSSSMVAQGPPPSRGSAASLSPPGSSQGPVKPSQIPSSALQQPGPQSAKSTGGFFAELPVTSKPKPAGRYTPQPLSPAMDQQGFQTKPSSYHPPQIASPQSTPSVQGLVAPPKVSPFAPLQTSQSQPPVLTSRYSPAPARSTSGSAPPPAVGPGRYAAAPSVQQQQSYTAPTPVPSPPAAVLPHQPRTSSPLIHFERAPDERSISGPSTETRNPEVFRRESSGFDQTSRPYMPQGRTSPTKRVTSNYVPDLRPGNITQEPPFLPPQRAQTQSPGKVMASTRGDIGIGEPYQRPLSVHSPTSPRQMNEQFASLTVEVPKPQMRLIPQAVNYIAPTDGREHDPLQRWQGGPVFAWGVGGAVITSFPKKIPRYGMGQAQPMILCSPGEVKVRNLREIYPLEERLAGFPGPLKGKSKKKDVLTWLSAGIEILERENNYLASLLTLGHEDKRKEERLLLWKILRVMIENDGILEGNQAVNKAVRGVLSPELESERNAAAPQYSTGSNLSSTLRATTSGTLPEPVNPAAVDQLRRYLLQGEREKAVWEAVDKRLWAHAMLISNTLPKEVHKQVAQEFIQKEVKGVGENAESLAALYEIFAGNFEESVDELVPLSARAGLQMMNASGTSGSSKSALDGLDRWRETLGLVLSNRSPEDIKAITALGKLLSGYGRAEAAHICFLFARGFSVFGGVDDPSSNIVLVGSDHLRQPYDFDRELEPTLLSEVYEYGLSLSGTSNVSFSAPHLGIYKLQHAITLAEFGQREKALQYCDAIGNSITSQVRRSPYHHSALIAALDDLSKRLKQSPKDESSSWIPKPSIDKVSGSLWGKFNKFVAGEDDATSGGAGSEAGSEVGPFARIAGDTPIISRSPSNTDIYGSINGAPINGSATHLPPMKPISRYAPGGTYTPPGAQDPSLSTSYGSPPRGSYMQRLLHEDATHQEVHGPEGPGFIYQSRFNDQMPRSYPDSVPSLPSSSYGKSASPYLGSSYAPQHSAAQVPNQYTSLATEDSHRLVQVSEGNPSPLEYVPPVASSYEPPSMSGYEPPSGHGYEPPSGEVYEPPSNVGYEPPSYEPGPMNDEPDSPLDRRPKKKSFMDDNDDLEPPTPAPESKVTETSKVEKTKAEKDREADEAFRRAAEADAQKAAASASAKKGWGLGGWFAKKETAADSAQANKPIRAKLGEESSFVYDPELKRWVNKKSSKDSAQGAPLSTPPPPRAGPPRSVSGSPAMEPTSAPRDISSNAPPKRAVSAMAMRTQPGESDSLSGLLVPTPMSRSASNGSVTGPPSGPPSRPTTSMSNASSIDDLLGPPQARKGTAKKPKRGRGYIDVMEKTST